MDKKVPLYSGICYPDGPSHRRKHPEILEEDLYRQIYFSAKKFVRAEIDDQVFEYEDRKDHDRYYYDDEYYYQDEFEIHYIEVGGVCYPDPTTDREDDEFEAEMELGYQRRRRLRRAEVIKNAYLDGAGHDEIVDIIRVFDDDPFDFCGASGLRSI
jgi:hypothetical protein